MRSVPCHTAVLRTMVMLYLCSAGRADVIPLHEEFIFAQALHVNALWDTVLSDLVLNAGVTEQSGVLDYAGMFNIAAGGLSGDYAGTLTTPFLGGSWNGSYDAVMTVPDPIFFSC